MSISPQPTKSNEPSRPVSPAADALEILSLNEEAISPEEAARMKANLQRKGSSWSRGLKHQLSKAEMKLKSTFGSEKGSKGSVMEGTIISPMEISPDSVESGPTTPTDENDGEVREKSEKISDLIKNIEELGAECDKEFNPQQQLPLTKKEPTTSAAATTATKRVDFVEEPIKKVSVATNEGAGMSRPTELPFGGFASPTAPPRMKKDGKRLERLMSVPNIKLNKQDQNRLLNLRKTSNIVAAAGGSGSGNSAAAAASVGGGAAAVGVDQKANKNKGNFIRRFSKYQFQGTHFQPTNKPTKLTNHNLLLLNNIINIQTMECHVIRLITNDIFGSSCRRKAA